MLIKNKYFILAAIAVFLVTGSLLLRAYGTRMSSLYLGTGTPDLTEAAGTFECDGAARIDGAIDANSTANFQGAVTLQSTLAVTGAITASSTLATDTLTINDKTLIIGEGDTADDYETTIELVEPAASDKTVLIPNMSGAVVLSTLTTNVSDAANSIWLGTSQIIAEGSGADDYETTIAFTNPTADRTVTIPNAAGAVMLSSLTTNGADAANAVTGGTNQLIFEGSGADDYEIIITATNPTADRTFTLPNTTSGTFAFSSLATNGIDAAGGVWLADESIVIEGNTADDYELTINILGEPAADKTVSIPVANNAVVAISTLASNDVDADNSIWLASNNLVFECATGNDYETSITPTEATADRTITIPDASGTLALTSSAGNYTTTGNVDADGTLTMGSGGHALTNAAGLIDGEKIQDDTIDDDSIDFGDVTLDDLSGNLASVTGYAQLRGFQLYNPHTVVLAGATAASATQSAGAGTTIQLGTNNGRDGALEALEIVWDGDADDSIYIDWGSTVDATTHNFLGFWLNCSGAVAAGEYTIRVLDASSVILDGFTVADLRAAASGDWTYQEVDITGATDKTDFHMVEIADTDTNALTCTFAHFEVYAVSNGNGPCNGMVERMPVATGTIDKGDIVGWESAITHASQWGIAEASDQDFAVMGVACDTNATGETSYALVQTSGIVVLRAEAAIADNAAVNPGANVPTQIDDDGSIENQFGYAMEAATDADEYIFVRMIK